jgi:hypothetical protein
MTIKKENLLNKYLEKFRYENKVYGYIGIFEGPFQGINVYLQKYDEKYLHQTFTCEKQAARYALYLAEDELENDVKIEI